MEWFCLLLCSVRHMPYNASSIRMTQQFSSFFPGDLELWPWHSDSSERGIKHIFPVNLVQIHSAVPDITLFDSQTNKKVTDSAKTEPYLRAVKTIRIEMKASIVWNCSKSIGRAFQFRIVRRSSALCAGLRHHIQSPRRLIYLFIYLFIYYYARWQPDIQLYKTVIYTLHSYTKIKNIKTQIIWRKSQVHRHGKWIPNQFSDWVVWQFRWQHIIQTTHSNKSLMHATR